MRPRDARLPGGSAPPWLPTAALAAVAASLTALSWVRYASTGALNLTDRFLDAPWDAVAAIGFATALLAAWWAHRAIVDRASREAWTDDQVLRRITWTGLALAALAAPMLPLLSDDLFSLLAYADLTANTRVNPFTLRGPGLSASTFFPLVAPLWSEAPCVYGPAQLLFWAPAVAGRPDPLAGVLAAKALGILATSVLLALLYVHARRARHRIGPAAFAAVALNPILWVEGAGQVHNDLLAAVFLAAWLLAADADEVPAAAALMGLAIASKLTAVLPAGMYLLFLARRPNPARQRFRDAGAATLVLAIVLVASWAPVWDGAATILAPLAHLGSRAPTNTFAEPLALGLAFLGADWFALVRGMSVAGTVALGLLAVAGAIAAWRARTLGEVVRTAAGLSILAVTIATPVFHPWYLLPPLVLALELRSPTWRTWLVGVSSLGLLVDGSALVGPGPFRPFFMVASVGLASVLWFWALPARLRDLRAPSPPHVLETALAEALARGRDGTSAQELVN